MDKLAWLVSRAEIEDLMTRYARGVDRRDWPAVRACYHEDALDDHAAYSGDVDGFIAWVTERHAEIPFSAHFLGNCLIEFVDEDTAIAETYFMVMRHGRPNPRQADAAPESRRIGFDGTDVDLVGRYLDVFTRRDGAWRIAQRKVVSDASRVQSSRITALKGPGALGRRDGNDPVYAWRKSFGL